jgi:hypothetical protein
MKKTFWLALVLAALPAFGQTGWQPSRLTSPMGDNSGIILSATAVPIEGAGTPSDQTGLAIQCSKKNGLEVMLTTGVILKDSGKVSDESHKGLIGGLISKHSDATLSPVRIRFDQQKAKGEEWMQGANPSNLFAQKAKKFVDALLKDHVQEVVIEAQPVADNPVFFKFDVRGLDQYKTELHENCGY